MELENNRESDYRDNDSKLIRKYFAFVEFAKGHFQSLEHFADFNDFNVDTYRLSIGLCRNLAAKAAKRDAKLNTRRFWIAPIPEVIAGKDRIYVTPKDYKQAVYSLKDV